MSNESCFSFPHPPAPQLWQVDMTGMPGIGLRISWVPAESRQDGRSVCARFTATIVGQEAFSFGAFASLLEGLQSVPHTTIEFWDVVDIEA